MKNMTRYTEFEDRLIKRYVEIEILKYNSLQRVNWGLIVTKVRIELLNHINQNTYNGRVLPVPNRSKNSYKARYKKILYDIPTSKKRKSDSSDDKMTFKRAKIVSNTSSQIEKIEKKIEKGNKKIDVDKLNKQLIFLLKRAECPVCLQNITSGVFTVCHHFFCDKCFEKLKSSYNTSVCPLCRSRTKFEIDTKLPFKPKNCDINDIYFSKTKNQMVELLS